MTAFNNLEHKLRQRKADELYRQRRVVSSAQGRELEVDGKKLLNFCSNDYLGLANDSRVREAFRQGISRWGSGSGASHLVCGHTSAHHELELALAEFTGRPRALLFSSGYAANMGAINALLGKGDFIFEDRLNHASLLDGGKISGARFSRYLHRDTDDLDRKLTKISNESSRKLIVSDGTFSMDGTCCDVSNCVTTAAKHSAWLMLDEAHSLGVIGNKGQGLVDPKKFGTNDVQILIGTLGKAFGTQGGFVAGSEELIETLIQDARTYIYTTALPAAIAEATLASLKIAAQEDWRREHLQSLIKLFRSGARELGLDLLESVTPIQPIVLGTAGEALKLSAALEERGYLISAIRPPTVPAGSSRLRITFTAEHSQEDVNQLLTALSQVSK